MSTFESDDLLLRSQMLISKFRRQREVALNQQITSEKKPLAIKQFVRRKDLYIQNKKPLNCDSYPQPGNENILLNKFMDQHFFAQSIEENRIKTQKYYKQNISGNVDLSSDSGSSSWSASSPTEREIKMVDCGIMTDCVQHISMVNDEVMTPVTTLPPTFRTHSERNIFQKMEIESYRQPNKFSSICTQFLAKNSDADNAASIISVEGSIETFDENYSRIINNDFHLESEEEDKMKAAWEYFQEEKNIERRITKQIEFVNALHKDMDALSAKIENESHKLDEMMKEKEEFRIRRYGIFNGSSKEIKSNVNERCEIMNESNCINNNKNIAGSGYFNDQNSQRNELGNGKSMLSPLDSDTVRNIVNKIVAKEFCNSEDRIFDKILTNPMPMYKEEKSKSTITRNSDDECVLSDVLSIKDLKIRPPTFDNETKTSNSKTTSSITIFNNSDQRSGQKPPKLKKKLRPAQSADNINQMVSNSKIKRRKNAHSPSISVDLKRYLYSSSSSDESIFNPSILIRR